MAELTVAPKPAAPPSAPPAAAAAAPSALQRVLDALTVPVLSVLTAMIVGAVIIAISDDAVLAALPHALTNPLSLLGAIWNAVWLAYSSLLSGALGSPRDIVSALASGNSAAIIKAVNPLSESLVTSAPYIFAGLAVALGFRAGLFNIGAEGQIFAGALASAYVGYAITGLPWIIHLPLALLAGAAAGAIAGAIPGYLKAKTGAHEVITTIMLNYMIFNLSDWLLNGPMKAKGGNPRSPEIESSAYLPVLFNGLRIHWGFIIALVMAGLVYWFLWKTTLGFELRMVGVNPRAAKYAGVNITRNIVLAMALSGALAGLAGANELLGVNHYMANAFSPGYGFDSIALALLGRSHPLGVVISAVVFGVLRSGATRMQTIANVPVDIISIIQAMIIAFIAAPAIVRWIYRVRVSGPQEQEVFTRGWGG